MPPGAIPELWSESNLSTLHLDHSNGEGSSGQSRGAVEEVWDKEPHPGLKPECRNCSWQAETKLQ